MFYDALTLRAYGSEVALRYPLPWFVQKLSQVDEHDYLMSCRLGPGKTLRWLISLQPGQPTWGRWHGPKPQAQPPSSFTMLCRKHLQGRSIQSLEVLYPERIVRFCGREHSLVLELLDRQPNLILVDSDDVILGGHRLKRSPERDLRPRRAYVPPPRPDEPAAQDLSTYQLQEAYLSHPPPEWPQSLLHDTFGLSPAACGRLTVKFDDIESSWKQLWASTEPGGYRAVRLDNRRLSIWGEPPQPAMSLLEIEESSWTNSEPSGTLPGLEVQRLKALKVVAKNRQKLRLRLEKLAQDRERVQQADLLQRQGELLLTYQHQVARGADSVELLDFDGSTRLKISLDPALPVVTQAQKMMKRASKYRRSLSVVEARVQETQAELQRLEELAFQVQQAEALVDLQDLSIRPARKSSPQAPRAGPRLYTFDGYRILVGRSPRQNDQLVQKHSARDDLWFHVKDAPGAHVLLKTAGRPPSPEVIEACAFLAARYSSKVKESRVLVSFAAAQKVKKPAGSPAGFVLYTEELTLWVRPEQVPQGLARGDLEGSG